MEKFKGLFTQDFRENFYNNLIGEDSLFQRLLLIAMVLYVALTAATFLLGMTNITQTDLLHRVLKIGLIYTVLTPGSWEYFSYLIKIFEEGASDLSLLISGTFLDVQDITEVDIYSLVDEIVNMFFQPPIHYKISAVFFSPILVGIILFFMIYYALFLTLYAIAKSVVIYFVIKFMFTILFMIGPIFIIFALFERTKNIFNKWLNMVISYSFQILFLFITIAFFSYLIVDIFYQMFFYGVCWKPVWIMKIGYLPEFEFFSFWRFHGFDARYSDSYNVSRGPDFSTTLFFLTIAYIFNELTEKVTALGDELSGDGGIPAGFMARKMIQDGSKAAGSMFKSIRKGAIQPIVSRALYGSFIALNGVYTGVTAPFRALTNKIIGSKEQVQLDALLNSHKMQKDKLGEEKYNNIINSNSERAYNILEKLKQAKIRKRPISLKNMTMLRAYDYITSASSRFNRSYKKDTNFTSKAKDFLGAHTIPEVGPSYAFRIEEDIDKAIYEAKKMLKNSSLSYIDQQDFIRNKAKSQLAKHKMSKSARIRFNKILDNRNFGIYSQDEENRIKQLQEKIEEEKLKVDQDLISFKKLMQQYEQGIGKDDDDIYMTTLREKINIIQENNLNSEAELKTKYRKLEIRQLMHKLGKLEDREISSLEDIENKRFSRMNRIKKNFVTLDNNINEKMKEIFSEKAYQEIGARVKGGEDIIKILNEYQKYYEIPKRDLDQEDLKKLKYLDAKFALKKLDETKLEKEAEEIRGKINNNYSQTEEKEESWLRQRMGLKNNKYSKIKEEAELRKKLEETEQKLESCKKLHNFIEKYEAAAKEEDKAAAAEASAKASAKAAAEAAAKAAAEAAEEVKASAKAAAAEAATKAAEAEAAAKESEKAAAEVVVAAAKAAEAEAAAKAALAKAAEASKSQDSVKSDAVTLGEVEAALSEVEEPGGTYFERFVTEIPVTEAEAALPELSKSQDSVKQEKVESSLAESVNKVSESQDSVISSVSNVSDVTFVEDPVVAAAETAAAEAETKAAAAETAAAEAATKAAAEASAEASAEESAEAPAAEASAAEESAEAAAAEASAEESAKEEEKTAEEKEKEKAEAAVKEASLREKDREQAEEQNQKEKRNRELDALISAYREKLRKLQVKLEESPGDDKLQAEIRSIELYITALEGQKQL